MKHTSEKVNTWRATRAYLQARPEAAQHPAESGMGVQRQFEQIVRELGAALIGNARPHSLPSIIFCS